MELLLLAIIEKHNSYLEDIYFDRGHRNKVECVSPLVLWSECRLGSIEAVKLLLK